MDNLTAAKYFYLFSNSGGGGDPALAVLNDGNTVAWYDYTENITEDSGVTVWGDKSGSGNDLKQPYGHAPLLTANGVLFDGSDDYMKCDAFTLNQPIFIYLVMRHITWTSGDKFFDGNADSAYVYQVTATPQIRARAGANSNPSTDLVLNTFGVVRVLFNGATSKFIINNNAPITGNFGANNMGGFTLGANATGGQGANAEYKEVIIRKVSDSEANETIIYNYLYNKYMLGGADAAFLAEDGSEMLFEDGSTVIPE